MQLKVKETAKLLGTTEKTLYRWIKQRSIPVCEVNEQFRFNRAEILEWATAKGISISPDVFLETEEEVVALPSLAEALEGGGVAYGLAGRDKPAVLRSLVDAMTLPEEVDREFLYQVLLARESLGSTGVGNGIAIPHVRNPVVLRVAKPMMTLCFLAHPIEFDAIDGLPVTTLFALTSPTVKAHLHMLSRLRFVLQHAGFKKALAERAPREVLMSALASAEGSLPAPR